MSNVFNQNVTIPSVDEMEESVLLEEAQRNSPEQAPNQQEMVYEEEGSITDNVEYIISSGILWGNQYKNSLLRLQDTLATLVNMYISQTNSINNVLGVLMQECNFVRQEMIQLLDENTQLKDRIVELDALLQATSAVSSIETAPSQQATQESISSPQTVQQVSLPQAPSITFALPPQVPQQQQVSLPLIQQQQQLPLMQAPQVLVPLTQQQQQPIQRISPPPPQQIPIQQEGQIQQLARTSPVPQETVVIPFEQQITGTSTLPSETSIARMINLMNQQEALRQLEELQAEMSLPTIQSSIVPSSPTIQEAPTILPPLQRVSTLPPARQLPAILPSLPQSLPFTQQEAPPAQALPSITRRRRSTAQRRLYPFEEEEEEEQQLARPTRRQRVI
jgi:hypothetical protein